MQRKGRKYKNVREKLHSIPIMKDSSNIILSTSAAVAFLIGLNTILLASECYADIWECTDEYWCSTSTAQDSSTITTVSGGTSTPPTVSLSLSKPSMVSDTTTPGSTATVSTGVTVDVENADSYTLTLKVDNDTMTSGNTIISAGNVVSDNTWGYKWDGAANYTAPSTSGTALTVPAVDNSGNSSFTKNLIFGVKFASDADAGHYKASGTLSLVANPRAAVITLADLTEMQQLAEGYAPEACENTPYLDGLNYSAEYTLTDVRDGNTYTVRKLEDGKCWMTQNLRLSSFNIGKSMLYTGGRKLIPTTSNIDTEYTLPVNITTLANTNFSSSDYYKAESYIATPNADAGETGYYSFTAATAGWATSSVTSGSSPQSICPKGWILPTRSEFSSLNSAGGVSGGNIYPWYYTGKAAASTSITSVTSNGYWWTNAVGNSSYAYYIGVYDKGMSPLEIDFQLSRYYGYAIRCVAQSTE